MEEGGKGIRSCESGLVQNRAYLEQKMVKKKWHVIGASFFDAENAQEKILEKTYFL